MNNDILNDSSVAVLVDCWESDSEDHNNFYKNIIKFIDETPQITVVILATYDANDLKIVTTNTWYKNALLWMRSDKRTSKIILDYINVDKLQIAMDDFDDFTHFLDRFKGITNIYFMGHSWNKCIHDRPIGIDNCTGLKRNIIINQTCVWNQETGSTLNIEKDHVYERCVLLKNNIYQLFGKDSTINH